MLKYCTKRILLAILTIFIVAAITFFAMNAIPGGPFNKEKATSEAAKAVSRVSGEAQRADEIIRLALKSMGGF